MTRFELRAGLVVFCDSRPGEHATMFAGDGRRLPFRGDASRFDDRVKQYEWAFEGELAEGERVVFATTDREVAGVHRAGRVAVAAVAHPLATRAAGGKPVALERSAAPPPMPVDQVLRPPFPKAHPRPEPMVRPEEAKIETAGAAAKDSGSDGGGR